MPQHDPYHFPNGTLVCEDIEGAYADLTGMLVVGCLFRDCIVRLDSGEPAYLSACDFENCRFYGDGWPKNMLDTIEH